MDRIINIYNKIRKNNKLLTAVVSALGVCLLAVLVLLIFALKRPNNKDEEE